MTIPLHERGIVFQFLFLAKGFDARAGGGGGAPEADVAVVGAGEEVVGVRGVG